MVTTFPRSNLYLGLYCVSQYPSFPCSTHLPKSDNIYNNGDVKTSSTVLYRRQYIARSYALSGSALQNRDFTHCTVRLE
jgi:hypothetical protein